MQNIDITGFLFLSSPYYQPEADLKRFLEAGQTPIYVGFGSIVVDDPDAFTRKSTTRVLEHFRLTLINRSSPRGDQAKRRSCVAFRGMEQDGQHG